jgi:hypothetical protein
VLCCADGPTQLVGPSVRRLRLSSDRQVIQRVAVVVTEHDVLVGYPLRLVTLAEERGNVSEVCRLMGVHRSTCYRWKRQVDRWTPT